MGTKITQREILDYETPYRIVPSIVSLNLVVELKHLDGSDPSTTNPIRKKIGDSIREVTSALSVTITAGGNLFKSDSTELIGKEIDYFVYLGYNATDGVVLGVARIPYANSYDDFSTTASNEKYCAISTITNAAATDYYEVIGRFAATHIFDDIVNPWTVPTFTAKNLINRPIYETRWLSYQPVYSALSPMTYTSVTTYTNKYKFSDNTQQIIILAQGTTGGTASTDLYATYPFAPVLASLNVEKFAMPIIDPAVGGAVGVGTFSDGKFRCRRYGENNWALGANVQIAINATSQI